MERTYLDLSTAHITQHTSRWLDSKGPSQVGLIVYRYDEGYFITVPGEPLSSETPFDIASIVDTARENGVSLIRLDRDVVESKDFVTYDW